MSKPYNIWHQLVRCPACGHDVSVIAEACPQCGAPNGWQHPLIERFNAARADMGTAKPFTFWTTRTKVWGETKQEPPVWAAMLTMLLMIGGGFVAFAFWGFLGAAVAGAMSVIPVAMTTRKETFSADLQSGAWECSNDTFWKPVKSKLMP